MKHLRHTVAFAALTAAVCVLPAAGMEITVDPTTQFTFSAEDFIDPAQDSGIFITAVPRSTVADLCMGNRILQPGDALDKDALDDLYLQTTCVTEQDVAVEYCTISDGRLSGSKALKLSILPKKNNPPVAEDASLETYRNIPNHGELKASDPEDGLLTYQLLDAPKRGDVELCEDGSFTYTPHHNKVGKDSFTFTVTDDAGNVSDPATVSVRIKKPTEKATYADMTADPDRFYAAWMREQGLYVGDTVGGHLCFSPEEPVSRGDFLIMTMKLVNAEADDSQMTSGFSDEADTAPWLKPYLTAALRNGMITGIADGEGVAFQAHTAMTKAEAAVMLQNILQLPVSETQAVFSPEEEEAVPAWAAEAVSALSQAGVDLEITSDTDPMTRRDAAAILYHVNQLIESKTVQTFYWVQ